MVFRVEAVRTRLKKLSEVLSQLRQKEIVTLEQYLQDRDLQWTIERGLELACSAVFDIGNHILAGAFQIAVEEYEQILKRLAEQKVISDELYGELRGLGGFRNILVHAYLEINSELVYSNFKKSLQVLPRFIAEIESWVERHGKGAGGNPWGQSPSSSYR